MAFLVFATGGCLYLGPVQPAVDPGPNQPPEFTFHQPSSLTVTLPNDGTSTLFIVHASDPPSDPNPTPTADLFYEWILDGATSVLSGKAATNYSTSGATLGLGSHSLEVIVSDDQGGTSTLTWSITVQ